MRNSLGQERYFHDRLHRQHQGRGQLLVAWLEGVPVGDVYLWLKPAVEPEVRELLPGVPTIQHLEVREDLRNHRIGTALIRAAEQVLRNRGHDRVALGVALENHGALRLYLRNGYREWRHSPITTTYEEFLPHGRVLRHPDVCRILIKDIGNLK